MTLLRGGVQDMPEIEWMNRGVGPLGAKEYPIIYTEHPISELTREQLRQRAEEFMPQLEAILLG